MQDLDAVRQAIGAERINLVGASYGTRAALTYMRRFPERVRSVVLDSVAGPELVLFLQMPQDGQRALDLLFDRCAADAACNEATGSGNAPAASIGTSNNPAERSMMRASSAWV